jgi:type I restriction-modification system DNA methylase subunit
MYNLKHNNYNLKPKASNIQTPPSVSQFIFELLKDKFPIKKGYPILDPCCGKGSLVEP